MELNYDRNIKYFFTNKIIYYNDVPIVGEYKEYRDELSKYQKNKSYGDLWNESNIYTIKINEKNKLKDRLNYYLGNLLFIDKIDFLNNEYIINNFSNDKLMIYNNNSNM